MVDIKRKKKFTPQLINHEDARFLNGLNLLCVLVMNPELKTRLMSIVIFASLKSGIPMEKLYENIDYTIEKTQEMNIHAKKQIDEQLKKPDHTQRPASEEGDEKS